MEKYVFIIRNYSHASFDVYVIGVIQGLIYGLCAIPENTTLWDCEVIGRMVIFPVDTTKDRCDECLKIINQKWPGICHYKNIKEL